MRNSNTCPNGELRGWIVVCTAATVLLANFLCSKAHGLDPQREYGQYLSHRWTLSNGFPGGRINSISQTSDGYLWIATSNGLLRFDGFNFVSVGKLNQATEPISQALTLVPDKYGGLWVMDQSMHVQRDAHGKFEDLASLTGMGSSGVAAITRSNEGGLLAATLEPKVFQFRNGTSESVTGPNNLSIAQPQAIAETSDGKIWMATYEEGLFYWEHGQTQALKDGVPDSKVNCLLPVENGGLWVGTDNGLAFWDGKKISKMISSQAIQSTRVLSLAEDNDKNLWIGTSGGLYRLNSGVLSRMQPTRNRAVTAIYEDSERNLWVGDEEGIECLRDGTFATYSVGDGLPPESVGPVYVDWSKRTWAAPSGGGLYRISAGRFVPVARKELGRDVIYSITGSGGDIWVGRREGGLSHLSPEGSGQGGAFAVKTYTHAEGLAQNSVSSVFRSGDGSIWAGTLSGGVSRLKDGKFVTFTSSDGLGSNSISSIEEGADGAMWFATSDGLSEFSKGRWRTYTARNGLPSDELTTLFIDSSGILWIGTSEGMAYLLSGAIRSVADTKSVLHEPVLGIADDRRGFLWVTTSSHVIRVRRSGLLKGRLDEGEYQEYGEADGLKGTKGIRRDRSVVAGAGGTVWLSTIGGLSMVDLNRSASASFPATPQVEFILADGKQTDLDGSIQIPPAPKRITIGYVALNLSTPGRVRYRYRLDGFDPTWSEPIDIRQVVYTNLGPGSYKFAVMASNSDGEWNGTETDIQFMIQPTLWQTWWFRLSFAMLAVAVFWVFYLYRLRLATSRIQERLDAQLEERVRIARELHDTLLQGFQGLMLRLQGVLKILPEEEAARGMIEQVLDRGDQVLLEGRESVKDLRQVGATGDELSQALTQCGEDLRQGTPVVFSLSVNGAPQTLGQIVFNDAVRVGTEALANSFRHAEASNIGVEITYSKAEFCLRIRDDGVGIPASVLHQGRAGHWGLSGMRERAQKIGGKLSIWTGPNVGTEVELKVPAKVAYLGEIRPSLWDRIRGRTAR